MGLIMEKDRAARYEKSKKFLPQNVSSLIKNLQPAIAWSPSEKLICYRHDTTQGYEYLIFNLKLKRKSVHLTIQYWQKPLRMN